MNTLTKMASSGGGEAGAGGQSLLLQENSGMRTPVHGCGGSKPIEQFDCICNQLEAAKQRELELLAVIEKMKSAAQAVVDKWETTYWKEIDPDSNLYLCTTRCPAIRTIPSTPRTRSEGAGRCRRLF